MSKLLSLITAALLAFAGTAQAPAAASAAAPSAAFQDTEKSRKELDEEAAEMSVSQLERELEQARDAYEAAIETQAAAKAALDAGPEGEQEALQAELDAAKAERAKLAVPLTAWMTALKEKGESSEALTEVNQLLITHEGLSTDTADAAAVLGLGMIWFNKAKDYMVDNGPGLIFKAVVFLLVLFAFSILGRIFGSLVGKALSTSKLKVSNLLRNFAVGITKKLILVIGLMIALGSIGIDIGPLLAGVGVIGFVVGFALQDTLSNFASGVMILLYRPYDVGDVITAGGVTGKVANMSLVSTTILTPDNQTMIVPNGGIWGGVITNVTANDTRRVDLTMGIGYDDDIEHAERVIEEVVKAHEKVLAEPAPVIKVGSLGDSSVNILVRPWSKTSDYWDVYWDLTRSLKLRFDQEGISIPFPQRDVHLFPASNGDSIVPTVPGTTTPASAQRATEADKRAIDAE